MFDKLRIGGLNPPPAPRPLPLDGVEFRGPRNETPRFVNKKLTRVRLGFSAHLIFDRFPFHLQYLFPVFQSRAKHIF